MIINSDCIDGMRMFPDNYFDSVVTDPPYELGFMGKTWDASGIAYNVAMWREALRVLKPGGHMLTFGGSRTYHRMVCAIEDAGFEVRDQIMWIYGSGFPKSLDVSKAIDKAGGDALAWRAFSNAYAVAVESSPLTHSDIDRALGIKSSSCYWARTDRRGGMPPRHHWETVRALLDLPHDFTRLYDEAEREVIGQRTTGIGTGGGTVAIMGDGSRDITAPATPAAQKWQGWGTALKPAHEPICVARKPLAEGTVAANVLEWGTGAVNIDACRVDTMGEKTGGSGKPKQSTAVYGNFAGNDGNETSALGRWPANLIHDGSEQVLAAFPQASGAVAPVRGTEPSAKTDNAFGEFGGRAPSDRRDGGGSASRFFYCAKASPADRHEGLPHPGHQFQKGSTLRDAENLGADRKGNIHPTVKPVDLMRYLCRLITPPGGTVLDPFAGSGSTGKAAVLEGFSFVGLELSAEYAAIAQARIDAVRTRDAA